MKLPFSCVLLAFLFFNTGIHAQNLLQNAEDTAFLLENVYYPKMQVQMSIFFNASEYENQKNSQAPQNVDSLKNMLGKSGDDALLYRQISEIYTSQGNDTAAIRARKKARDLYLDRMMKNNTDTCAIRNIGDLFLADFDFSMAEAYYKELTRVDSTNPYGWYGLASVNLMNFRLEKAEAQMKKALGIDESNIAFYCQMANIQCYKAYYKLSALPDSVLTLMNFRDYLDYSFIDNAMKKYPANKTLQHIYHNLVIAGILTEAFYDNPGILDHSSKQLHFNLKPETEKNLKLSETYMKTLLNNASPKPAFAYKAMMIGAFLHGDTAAARSIFEEGIMANPANRELLSTMVGIYALYWMKNESLNIQLRYNEDYPSHENFLITAYLYYSIKSDSLARYWTDKALQLNAYSIKALNGMAAVNIQMMNIEQALQFANLALKYYPKDVEAMYLRGILYILEGNPLQAKNMFARLNFDPQYKAKCQEISSRFLK